VLASWTQSLMISERFDWERFIKNLNGLVQTGVRRVSPLKRLNADNEEWYLDPETRISTRSGSSPTVASSAFSAL
jgi:hypothetical protein